MSREIDVSKPLSADDVEYLTARGRTDLVESAPKGKGKEAAS